MSDERARVLQLLAALTHRERRLLLSRALLQIVAASALVLALASALVMLRLPRELALGLWLLAAIGLPAAGLLWPALPGWRRAGDLVRQARLVERERPGLRGRLVTLAERFGGARAGESEALLELAAQRARGGLVGLKPREVHPAGPLRWSGLALALSGLLLLLSALLGPGPRASLRVLMRGASISPDAPARLEALPPEEALLGDILLRYRYPDYTGLDPLEVPNSTGDVHAPPGTLVELRARTAEAWDAAELELTREATAAYPASSRREPARLEDGRALSASFELVAPGSWAMALSRDGVEQLTARHSVVLDLDQAPEVLLLDADGVLEVAWDQPVPMGWIARDDYGVVRVEVESAGDDPRTFALREPLDAAARLEGSQDFTPADLGLMPGAEARLHIVAWDNDAIGGTKPGRSPSFRVRVLGPRGQTDRRRRVVRELRDAMLSVLADHLEDPWPVEAERGSVRAWGARSARRMDPVEQLIEDAWQGYEPEGFEGTIISAVRGSQASVVGFVNALGPSGARLQPDDMETLETLRSDLVHDLEQGVLTLDEVVRQLALKALTDRVEQLESTADRLESLRDAQPSQILSRLDRLGRQLDKIEQAATLLGDSSLAWFTHYRVRDVQHLSEAVRNAHSGGHSERGRAYQDRLVRELRSFAEQFGQLKQQRREMEEEAADRLAELEKELTALLAEQTTLLAELLEAVQQAGDPSQALSARWDRMAEDAAALSEALRSSSEAMMGHEGRPASEWRLAHQASEDVGRLAEALAARDLGRALEGVTEADWALQRLNDSVQRHADHAELLDRRLEGQDEVERSLGAARAEATELRSALEGLLGQLASEPGQLRGATGALAPAQAALQDRTAAAEDEARELMRMLPMEAPGLVEGVSRAADEMEQAEQVLPMGYAQEAEGSQRAAIQGLQEAIEALRQSMQDAQEMASMSESGGGGHGGGEDAGGGDQRDKRELRMPRIEIPTPEEFRTPEAYRQALLEGMQGDVPAEYRSLKRRYYEDLVRQ
jgi:hypothetical protein